ncbi:hypothetical protein C7M61_002693 [Candidozyma pseudohaemuli]|uniref:Uncharacterized protein n=1 Tax=Candidozyma pseudohaemuli TaxID=418784 RepID=A0A2P7YS18_9ASCO|nr:hypothetical protein C7M61_002693 [[Candida] pseudohaemulonii]PSK38754.1 hypothetical protein C7M61_002693 [[Candida] pseudohaemulonii]
MAYQPPQSHTARISHTTEDLPHPHIEGYDHAKIIGRLQESLKRDRSLKASMKRGSRAVIDVAQLMPPFADEERLDIKYGFKYHIKELFKHPRAEIKLLSDKFKRKISLPPFDGLQEELKVFDHLPTEPDSFKTLEKFVEKQLMLCSSSIVRPKLCGLRPRSIRPAVFYGTPRKKLFLRIDQIISCIEQEKTLTDHCNKTTQRHRIDALLADLSSELDTLNGKVNQRLLEISKTYINYSLTMMRCLKMMKELFEDHIIFRQKMIKEFTINGDFKGSPSTRRALTTQLTTLQSLTFQMYSIHNQIAARRIRLCGDLRVLSTIDSRIEEYYKEIALLHPSFKSLRRKSNSIRRHGFRPFNRAILDHCKFCGEAFQVIIPLRDRIVREMEDLYAALVRF